MPYSLVAWSESHDSAVLDAITAVTDQHVRTTGNDIIVPRGLNVLLGAYAIGGNLTQAQLQSPSLRRMLNVDIAPFERAATPNANTPRLYNLTENPIDLDEDEALNAATAEDAAGAARDTVIALLADGAPRPAGGDIYTLRATSTTAVTAYTWSQVQLTFSQTLPAGRYQVVGMSHRSASAIAARLVFVGGIWRPGCISIATQGALDHPLFRFGRLGVWGEFEHNTPPSLEVLAGAADASHEVFLDVIKVQ